MKRAAVALAMMCVLLPSLGAGGAAGSPSPRATTPFVTSGFVAAAGDLACAPDKTRGAQACHVDATGYLLRKFGGPFDLAGQRPDAIIPLGDMAYGIGNLSLFTYRNPGCQMRPILVTGAGRSCSFDDSWGRSVRVTEPDTPIHPVPGNHEYQSSDTSASCDRLLSLTSRKACGMELYFGDDVAAPTGAGTPSTAGTTYGDGKGNSYYMFDTAPTPMLFVALNTGACTLSATNEALCNGTNQDAPPIKFLRDTLSDSAVNPPGACVAVYYHQPRWSRYDYPTLSYMKGVWDELFDASIPQAQRADVVLNGHAHNYQRFAAVDASGAPSPDGIREIITGTGGNDHDTLPPACPLGETCIAPTAWNLTDFGAGRLEWDAGAARLRYSFYSIADDGTTALVDRLAWDCRT